MNNKEVLSKQDVYYIGMIFRNALIDNDRYFYNQFLGFGMTIFCPSGYSYIKHSINSKRKILIDHRQ
jgi:hypothetical protein